MTKKKMLLITGLYVFCTLIWTVNFFLHWHVDGQLDASTILYGISAVCFGAAAVLSIIRLVKMKNTED